MSIVHLVEVTAIDGGGTTQHLYLSDGRVGNPLQTMPVDDPDRPRWIYLPQVLDTNVELSIDGGVVGEVVIVNAGGTWDHLTDWRWGSAAQIAILRGTPGQYYAEFERLLSGPCLPPEAQISGSRVPTLSFRVRDRLAELEVDFLTSAYAGTNSGATGDEGTADDLQGRPKPRSLGRPRNVAGAPCNTSGDRTQVHDGPVDSVVAAYDEEVPLAIVAAPPAAGQVSVDTAAGIITHGESWKGTPTYDVRGASVGGYEELPGELIHRICLEHGWTDADLDLDALAALDTARPWPLGLHYANQVSRRQVIDDILRSVHAWVTMDAANRLTVGLYAAPTGTPVATWAYPVTRIVDFQTVGGYRADGRPVGRVEVGYDRNYTPRRPSGAAGAVTPSRQAWVTQEYRVVSWEDAQIQADWPDYATLRIDTAIALQVDAQALADRIGGIYATPPGRWSLAVPVDDARGVRPGHVVEVTYPADGFSGGKLVMVESLELGDPHAGMVTAKVWG